MGDWVYTIYSSTLGCFETTNLNHPIWWHLYIFIYRTMNKKIRVFLQFVYHGTLLFRDLIWAKYPMQPFPAGAESQTTMTMPQPPSGNSGLQLRMLKLNTFPKPDLTILLSSILDVGVSNFLGTYSICFIKLGLGCLRKTFLNTK